MRLCKCATVNKLPWARRGGRQAVEQPQSTAAVLHPGYRTRGAPRIREGNYRHQNWVVTKWRHDRLTRHETFCGGSLGRVAHAVDALLCAAGALCAVIERCEHGRVGVNVKQIPPSQPELHRRSTARVHPGGFRVPQRHALVAADLQVAVVRCVRDDPVVSDNEVLLGGYADKGVRVVAHCPRVGGLVARVIVGHSTEGVGKDPAAKGAVSICKNGCHCIEQEQRRKRQLRVHFRAQKQVLKFASGWRSSGRSLQCPTPSRTRTRRVGPTIGADQSSDSSGSPVLALPLHAA
jgi:hypothetical protein